MKKYLFIALAISATAQAEPTAKTFDVYKTGNSGQSLEFKPIANVVSLQNKEIGEMA